MMVTSGGNDDRLRWDVVAWRARTVAAVHVAPYRGPRAAFNAGARGSYVRQHHGARRPCGFGALIRSPRRRKRVTDKWVHY
jgi:hypothetical protein